LLQRTFVNCFKGLANEPNAILADRTEDATSITDVWNIFVSHTGPLEFVAARDIVEGEEILIDYGDRFLNSIPQVSHPDFAVGGPALPSQDSSMGEEDNTSSTPADKALDDCFRDAQEKAVFVHHITTKTLMKELHLKKYLAKTTTCWIAESNRQESCEMSDTHPKDFIDSDNPSNLYPLYRVYCAGRSGINCTAQQAKHIHVGCLPIYWKKQEELGLGPLQYVCDSCERTPKPQTKK